MNRVDIRVATEADAPALAELSEQLGYRAAARRVAARLRAMKGEPDIRVLVACVPDGSVAGWAHVFIARRVASDPFGELGGLVVAERYRGQGIGRSLLRAAESWVDSRGVDALRIRSRASRSGAHAFFLHSGFTLTKEQRVFDKQLRTEA